jgi:hypothetical protein
LIYILSEWTLPAALALLLYVKREDGVGPTALYVRTTDQNSRSLITTKFKIQNPSKLFKIFKHYIRV